MFTSAHGSNQGYTNVCLGLWGEDLELWVGVKDWRCAWSEGKEGNPRTEATHNSHAGGEESTRNHLIRNFTPAFDKLYCTTGCFLTREHL